MLHIGNLKYVKDPLKVISNLKEAMPNCIIKYPPYTENNEVEGTDEQCPLSTEFGPPKLIEVKKSH